MSLSIDESFRHCRRLSKRTGRNFYFSFLTLRKPLLRDMCALYAFMRVTDDLGDDESRSTPQRAAALTSWRSALASALEGDTSSHPVLPALVDIQQRHNIPPQHLHAVITGVEMDLDPQGFATFADLSHYCNHVAGAVGLCCVRLWGFDVDARETVESLSLDCGRAFQLTNILRDLGEDARNGRVYLPREDLEQFGYTTDDLNRGNRGGCFKELMAFQVARTRHDYQRALRLHPLLHPPGRPILAAMIKIYGGLLQEIERRDYDVFSARVELSTPRKLFIAANSVLRPNRPPPSI